ncbi:hypothetical protein [Bradyrhizobium australiense]|uniref:Uncharacterized protein n=1 Tax=Bradyrhizobium australiense TaxID=2721161 RepID=A0A7Y4LXI8_9BRAD|nr:hypothetical protein [Bradyrhizobium australiense]NOJ42557.1 hypothetical protein [Bradyrhizobium australiense]
MTGDADHFSATMRRMPIVQVRSWVERWQRVFSTDNLRACRRIRSVSAELPPFEFLQCPKKRQRIALSRAPYWPFFSNARVTDSSVYHLASALNGRGIGRMTPRTSLILHRAHILLPGE